MKKLVLLLCSITLLGLLLAGCASSTSSEADEHNFPEEPIELIVPFDGGSMDVLARAITKSMEDYLPNGQSVAVVNKPGGGATVGLNEVYNAEPDGYTIGLTPLAPIAFQPHFGETAYTVSDFQSILRLVHDPAIFIMNKDMPVNDFYEWVSHVKENPGEFKWGIVGGNGSFGHILMNLLNEGLGLETELVPQDGSNEIIASILRGDVDGGIIPPQVAIPQIEAGKVRALAYYGGNELEALNDVHNLADSGLDVNLAISTGIVAPEGLPEDRQQILHDAFKQAMEDPQVIKELDKMGTNLNYASSEDFQKELEEAHEISGEIFREEGLID